MGMYTAMKLNIPLTEDAPAEILQKDLNDDEIKLHSVVNAWHDQVLMPKELYKQKGLYRIEYDEEEHFDDYWVLKVRSSIKNYESIYEKFLSWVIPFVKFDTKLGWYQYEEYTKPVDVFKRSQQIIIMKSQAELEVRGDSSMKDTYITKGGYNV